MGRISVQVMCRLGYVHGILCLAEMSKGFKVGLNGGRILTEGDDDWARGWDCSIIR
jgi:hypothetical protein